MLGESSLLDFLSGDYSGEKLSLDLDADFPGDRLVTTRLFTLTGERASSIFDGGSGASDAGKLLWGSGCSCGGWLEGDGSDELFIFNGI